MCQSKLYARNESTIRELMCTRTAQPASKTLQQQQQQKILCSGGSVHSKTNNDKKSGELARQKDSIFDGNDLIMREFVRNKS